MKFIRQGTPGAKGERGPTLRGPQAWSDCAIGYGFQSGGQGEEWKDVVLYGNNYYSCVGSHVRTADNYPGSAADENNGYWRLGPSVELVATRILLSEYALVRNLGVERVQTTGERATIDIHDGIMEVFGEYCCNIRFGVDDNGSAVLEYYDNDGQFLYNLGPGGITSMKRSEDYWDTLRLIKTHEAGTTLDQVRADYTRGTVLYEQDRYGVYYRFHSGYIGNIHNDPFNDGKVFKSKEVSTLNYIDDGWYRVIEGNAGGFEVPVQPGDGLDPAYPGFGKRPSVVVMYFLGGACKNKASITQT